MENTLKKRRQILDNHLEKIKQGDAWYNTKRYDAMLDAMEEYGQTIAQKFLQPDVSGNEANQSENKKDGEVAVAFADWLADKGYVRANCFGKGEDEMYKEGLFKEFEIETAKATDR